MKYLILVFAVLFSFCASAGDVIYQNDFSRQSDYKKDFYVEHGVWKFTDREHTLRQVAGAPHRLGRIHLKKHITGNVSVEFTFAYLGGKSSAHFSSGLHFWHPEKEGYSYQIKFPTYGQKGISLLKVKNFFDGKSYRNQYECLAQEDSKRLMQNKNYKVKVILKDGNFSIYLDGEELMNFTDKSPLPASGKISFFTYGTAVDFDNLKVIAIP